MSTFMFMWRSSDHTMKEAIECSGLDYKQGNIVDVGYADFLDMVAAAETAANCLGRENDLGIGVTFENEFLEISESIKAYILKNEIMCPTELFTHKEHLAALAPHIYDRDKAMTISVVTWNTELYTLEEALKEGTLHRMNNPINASNSTVVSDILDGVIAGASAFSATPIGIAIEHGDIYIDLSHPAGLEIMQLAHYNFIEDAFQMEELSPYRKEII